jgi:hypothetical protein
MRAITQHHIEHDNSHFGVACFLQQAADAQIIVDHGVRATHGEFFLAQVDRRMSKNGPIRFAD